MTGDHAHRGNGLQRLIGSLAGRLVNGPAPVAKAIVGLAEAAGLRASIATPGATFSLRVGNRVELFRARTVFDKEPETIAWLDRTIEPISVFYDVGANVGVYTLYATTRHPSVRAVCFEPGAASFARLCENILDNGLGTRVIAFPLMASDDSGIAALALSDQRAGAAMHARAELGLVEGGPVQGSASMRLDDIVEPVGTLPMPTHLKVDVDGPEVQVLRGAARVLRSPTLRNVLVEAGDTDVDEIDAVLVGAGFSLVTTGRMIGTGAVTAQNRIYER